MSIFPKHVVIEEQGLRDGLQSESSLVPTAKKMEIINALIAAGLKRIQVTAFVNPQLVPQMTDSKRLCSQLDHGRGVIFSGLVLNERGVARAADSGLKHISASISASDTHSQKNTNASLPEARQRMSTMIRSAKKRGMTVRGGGSMCFWVSL